MDGDDDAEGEKKRTDEDKKARIREREKAGHSGPLLGGRREGEWESGHGKKKS